MAELIKGIEKEVARQGEYRLYRNDGQRHTWELPDGSRFQASIAGVAPDGMFTLQRPDGTQASYAFKQVRHVVGQATL